LSEHIKYMNRALELAALGTKLVKDNPKVGAVLVNENKIIGEGYHMINGKEHAEVNCLNSVSEEDIVLISSSVIYITLEPCYHEGKTPPCVDLIIKNKIKTVVVGTKDPNPKVGGKSIDKLKSLGIKVIYGVLEKECKEIIRPFLKMIKYKSPWVQLKFAKSKFNYLALNDEQIWLSSELSKMYVHRLRAQVDGIMIGTNTALIDDPALTTRLVAGDNPIRIILDRRGILPNSLQVFTDGIPTIYVTSIIRKLSPQVEILIHDFGNENSITNLLTTLYEYGIYRLMIEGGASLLQSVCKKEIWDEAIVINTEHSLNEGKKAPNLNGRLIETINLENDIIHVIRS